MDARLSAEQAELRGAAAKLADDLGPRSVLDLSDAERRARLEKAVASAGWRTLRSDGASGVEIAQGAEELARGLVDVPFLGRVLADALRPSAEPATIAVGGVAIDAKDAVKALTLDGARLLSAPVGELTSGVRVPDTPAGVQGVPGAALPSGTPRGVRGDTPFAPPGDADLTRDTASLAGPFDAAGEISAAHAARWQALAIVVTAAEQVGAARGAHALALEYSKVRAQYGHVIGSYQAISHLLAEGLALIEGSESILRYAAWAVDERKPAEAINAARIAKAYIQVAARTVCETAIQVHGGIGNTWECLAHVFLRRVLVSSELFPVRLEEIVVGLPGFGPGIGVPLQAAGMAR
jgi:hypothetical protein